MELKDFRSLFQEHEGIKELCSVADTPGEKIHLQGLIGSSRSLTASFLAEKLTKPIIICLNDKEEAAYFYDDLVTYNIKPPVLFFPSSYKRAVQYEKIEQENIILRTEVLNKLKELKKLVVVTYPEALVEKVVSGKELDSHTFRVKRGDKLSIEFLNDVLFEYGFERVDFVYGPGQYSVRGSIVDIFSFSHEDPYRIDFFGDDVDSIRSFDIDNQISKDKLDKIYIIPNIQQDLNEDGKVSFFEFISQKSVLLMQDIQLITDQVENSFQQTILKAEEEKVNGWKK